MLSEKMELELNKQVNAELYSSYLYLSMNAYLESINLKGFSNWMRVQAQEEWAHAMKIFDYIHDRGGKVTLTTIEAPKTEWRDIINVFEEVFEHEKKVTSLINILVTIAKEEKDHAAEAFLQWFVTEQVEEEANVDEILVQLKMIEGKGPALFMLDREMKQRVFVPIDSPQA